MTKPFLLCLALGFACRGPFTSRAADPTNHPAAGDRKFTYVIVHGAWGGGWDWKPVDRLLVADGHEVYRPTLTGQGEHSNLASPDLDLDTHIQDIVNLILWEDLHDVVLVGHSYGGMVITGVADRVPDRIKHLVYIDALLPQNGENVNAVIAERIKQPIKDGFITAPWVTGNPPPPHDVLMPAKCFSEPIVVDQSGCRRKIACHVHFDRGCRPATGAGRFLSILSARQGPGLDSDHHGRRPQCSTVAPKGTRPPVGVGTVTIKR